MTFLSTCRNGAQKGTLQLICNTRKVRLGPRKVFVSELTDDK